MSWLPDNDPVLGDVKSCDALELVIVPRTYCIPQSREPRMLDQCGVSGKLCARYSPRVNGSNVFGICG